MKQCIEIRQLEELSEEQITHLKKARTETKGQICRRMNIGKMIETISKGNKPIIETDFFREKPNEVWWIVIIDRKKHIYFSDKELVDALWEATKSVLEGEE